MGNKRSRRSRRLATPSPERGPKKTLVETPTQGNITLTNTDPNTQENLDDVGIRSQLIEPSQLINEIQSWTENFEQKNNDRIAKMREEMENKLDAILKEIKSNKSVSTVTNPRSEENTIQNMQPSGSKTIGSIGVHASYNNNSDSENEDYPLRASKMRDLKHPAKPIFRSESDVDVTIHSDEESYAESLDEDYHKVLETNYINRIESQDSLSSKFFILFIPLSAIGQELADRGVLFSLEAVVRPKHCTAVVFRAVSMVVAR